MNIEERYTNLFCTVFDVDASKLNSSFTFAETAEWDSMAHMELIAA